MATILTVLPPWVFAQSERTGSATAPASAPDSTGIVAEAPVVSLLTCAPGELVYELEGHTGLRFRTSTTDIVVNWGLFDFNSPGFIYRFVRGETDYTVGAAPTEWFLNQYRHQGRSVTEQVLNLTPTEALRLQQLVADNMQNNPVYRYNYVKDNCSLRPLRLIEKALAPDSIHFTDTVAAGTTFRSMMTDFHRSYPWYQFGIDLALGSGIDYRITTAEAAFAPVTLQKLAASAIITTPPVRKRHGDNRRGHTRRRRTPSHPLVSHAGILCIRAADTHHCGHTVRHSAPPRQPPVRRTDVRHLRHCRMCDSVPCFHILPRSHESEPDHTVAQSVLSACSAMPVEPPGKKFPYLLSFY